MADLIRNLVRVVTEIRNSRNTATPLLVLSHCYSGVFNVGTTSANCAPDSDGLLPLQTHKDREMNPKAKLMNPATIAALLVFAGAPCTVPAMADDRVNFDANELPSEQIEEASKEQARQATEAAVEDAVRAVEADTRLDLDIRLIGHNSVIIAGEV